jgi:multidrug efflux pump
VTLSDLSIRRPVLATVMSLMLLLIGILSFSRLSVREYPDIDSPTVSVRVVYAGASAEVIESQVTVPLEDALAGIEGVELLRSTSSEQVSSITVQFLPSRDLDEAASDVRDRVARARGSLPDGADAPIVAKADADAQAILWLALSSETMKPLDLTDFAERQIVDELKNLSGVSAVMMSGVRRFAMRIWLSSERMAALGITVQDVEDTLRRQNVEIPAGRVESLQREFTVQSDTGLKRPEQFAALIVREQNGYAVRLSDIGRVEIGAEDDRNIVRINGKPAVGLGIVKQSTANTLEVARAAKALLPILQARLPEGVKIQVSFDFSLFIERAVEEVYVTLAEAFVLVSLVIFLFLRGLCATLIPVVTIPISLIGAFIFLYALGFSINLLTLLGLVLAVGLVVDDAIVMLENIHRHIERGMAPKEAAFLGSREIAFAVLAMTLTLAAVFAPLAFMEGKTGRLFVEFAMTVSAAVLVSGFIALTLTPMLCSIMLRPHGNHGFYAWTERGFLAMNQGYRRLLGFMLHQRWIALLLVLLAGWAAWSVLPKLKQELAPLEDRGNFIINLTAPEGATLAYTDDYVRKLGGIAAKVPEVQTVFLVTAPGLQRPSPVTRGITFLQLKSWEQRERTQQDVIESLKGPLNNALPGVRASPIATAPLGQGRSTPVQFVVQAASYAELDKAVEALLKAARANPGLENVDTDLKLETPQLRLSVDRERAADLGVEVNTVGQSLETALAGRQVTRFTRDGKQYDVIVQLEASGRDQPEDIGSLYVRGRDGQLVQLANVASVTEDVAAKSLNHFNRKRAAILSANLKPGYSLGEALTFLDQKAAELKLATDYDGQSREFRSASGEIALTFILAVLFIYLVLAAQFESFVSPFIILLTVPLAAAGALATLLWTGQTFNVYSQIGLVMLVGLITKHGILIVEFANQLADSGKSALEAVTESAVLRLRPILMTTAAMLIGALPLALAIGAGAESRQPIGWVIVGGLAFGTLLTLFVIPSAWLFFRHGFARLTKS